ncbi:hypothetical protein K458DRAFT_392817 [Lentithecium fluviatile CBS 122367]|uniref:MYND-type domain-containing protein n=1 Tax=Lentithecium fluviatile CBS 122367 TaxID=1168545 RepID=A0A6G1IQU8_9PLEO|nr:hypothetical protein K458DRAFT_392817 [Lentithecium fluviatile CBS 122367]
MQTAEVETKSENSGQDRSIKDEPSSPTMNASALPSAEESPGPIMLSSGEAAASTFKLPSTATSVSVMAEGDCSSTVPASSRVPSHQPNRLADAELIVTATQPAPVSRTASIPTPEARSSPIDSSTPGNVRRCAMCPAAGRIACGECKGTDHCTKKCQELDSKAHALLCVK